MADETTSTPDEAFGMADGASSIWVGTTGIGGVASGKAAVANGIPVGTARPPSELLLMAFTTDASTFTQQVD